MSPSQLVRRWIECFNAGDPTALAALYAPDATNHQVVFDEPLRGREAIRRFFEAEFTRADMVCNEEQLFEDGAWAILEWSDPPSLDVAQATRASWTRV